MAKLRTGLKIKHRKLHEILIQSADITVFVHCRQYDAWRTTAADELHKRAKAKLTEKGFEEVDCIDFLTEAKLLFTDACSLWPLHYSAYYLGHVPNFD
jgi:hypothetical protein